MTRRALFAVLASLPFVGRFVKPRRIPSKVKVGYPGPTYEPSDAMYREANRYQINCGPNERPAFEEFGGPL